MAYNFRSWLLAAADMLSGCPWDKVCVISEVQRTFLERKSNTLCGVCTPRKPPGVASNAELYRYHPHFCDAPGLSVLVGR